MEKWRKIERLKNLYEVSDKGRVRSVGRVVKYRHGERWREGRFLNRR
jgi:hypothetical protein